MALILVVEDENLLRWALRRRLELQGHIVHEAATIADAEEHLKSHRPDVVLLDLNLPDGSGLDFFSRQKATLAESIVVMMTVAGSVEAAVRAMRLGAFDFVQKPLDKDELAAMLDHALERQREQLDAEAGRREREKQGRVRLVAECPAMKELLEVAGTVAASPATTILVTGETGTGKEVVARYIHSVSPRASRPILALNCAALPEALVESELFGHEKGAFTDAKSFRKGIFELADEGAVILDEIGELALPMQAKLLRFLEERTFRRVGGTREISVDVRVLALTNRQLEEAVEAGTFRRDLFYRINIFPIQLPALRERREDVLPLALHFVQQFGRMGGKEFTGFTPELEQSLLGQAWTGNVRELRNVMERISILEPGGIATGRFLKFPPLAAATLPASPTLPPEGIMPLDQVEFLMVQRAMESARGNQSQAARLLGVSRDQLRYRLKRYRAEGQWPEAMEDTGEIEAQ